MVGVNENISKSEKEILLKILMTIIILNLPENTALIFFFKFFSQQND